MNDIKNVNYDISRFNLLTSLLSILNRNDENDTDFIIARYFITHLNSIKNTSIYTIADECFVSRSSVQRFIKTIGYDSFTQLKANMDVILNHENGFIDYTDHAGYPDFISESITEMMADIIKATESGNYLRLVEAIINTENVVIVSAEDSASACRLFQQQLLTTGKLVRIVTSSSSNMTLLDNLKKDNLLLVCSVTGNFALAIDEQIRKTAARKFLITMNTTAAFEDTYSLIYYMGKNYRFNSRSIVMSKNVYNNYGMTFLFDLLYHECYLRSARSMPVFEARESQ